MLVERVRLVFSEVGRHLAMDGTTVRLPGERGQAWAIPVAKSRRLVIPIGRWAMMVRLALIGLVLFTAVAGFGQDAAVTCYALPGAPGRGDGAPARSGGGSHRRSGHTSSTCTLD